MMKEIQKALILAAALLPLFFMSGCAELPDNSSRSVSSAIEDSRATQLGQAFSSRLEQHPGMSGVLLLSNGLDAFVGRGVLAAVAERSIDVQYYMFHQDTVGQLLIDQLIKAANRGVRVRMLIDDMYGAEGDTVWAALDEHPDMEVRLFNPFVRNRSKNLQWLTRFKELNHRMHNKSFTVDNQITIVGGRNIGDEYFDATPELAFADLDMMAIGPVVAEVSDAFDQYWNSEFAYPASSLSGEADHEPLEDLTRRLDDYHRSDSAAGYIEALENSDLAKALRNGETGFEWARTVVIHDAADKLSRKEGWKEDLLITQLWPYMKEAKRELIIVSPYFVPGKAGTKALADLSRQGVTVRILTNSLASNDVAAVHSGYAKYRMELLKAGVALYELDEQIKQAVGQKFHWLPGLKKSSLHAKAMVIDRRAVFVGSMNLDLRSLGINNEIGILAYNQELARRNALKFEAAVEEAAFQLGLHEHNGETSIRWHLKKDGEDIVYDEDPYAGFWTKLGVWFIGLLPVESLL